MQIVAISDMHGKLDFSVPQCDILLIAGDICPAYANCDLSIPMQLDWFKNKFIFWLNKQPAQYVVFIAGNHDWIFYKKENRIPFLNLHNNWYYLKDSFIMINDLKIYGSPWQLSFNNWAFNRSEEELEKIWNNIPMDTDILLLHSPPYKILDKTILSNYVKHIGSKSLKRRIQQVKPKLVVFGHCHSAYGITEKDGILFINATLLNEQYQIVNKPILVGNIKWAGTTD